MPAEPHVPLQFKLFGKPEMRVNGASVRGFRQREARVLATYLILSGGQTVARGETLKLLWPSATNANSPSTQPLRHALNILRACLGPHGDRLTADTESIRFDLSDVWADLLEFDRAVSLANSASLEYAVSLYSGPLLDDCGGDWITSQREFREDGYLQALEALAMADLRDGRVESAEQRLLTVIAQDRRRASAWRLRLKCRARRQDRDGLKQTYARAHRQLAAGHAVPDDIPSLRDLTELYHRLDTEIARTAAHTSSLGPCEAPGRHENGGPLSSPPAQRGSPFPKWKGEPHR